MTQLEAYYIADDLRICLMYALRNTPLGAPEDSCTTYGQMTWDNCCPDMLRVAVLRQYASSVFPDPQLRPDNCNIYTRATDVQALVLRCAPNPNADGQPPTCEQLDKTAQNGAADMDAMWRAVACCFGKDESPFDYVIREIAPTGPRGGCIGTRMLVTVNLLNDCGCG